MNIGQVMEEREWLMQKRVEEALERVHSLLFADDMSVAESNLAWMQVVTKMLESVTIEKQMEVTKTWLRLTK